MGKMTFGVVDYDGTVTRRSWYNNVDDTNATAQQTAVGNFRTAMLDVQLSEIRIDDRLYQTTDTGTMNASSSAARNSVRWKISFRDDTTGILYTDTLPGADITDPLLVLGNSKDWDPTATKWVTFKSTFEAVARSIDGNTVTLEKVELID